MKTYTIIISVLLALSLGLLVKIGIDHFALKDLNDSLNSKLMEADLELGRARTKFGNAHKQISELEAALQAEIKARNGFITRIGNLEALLKDNQQGQSTPVIVPVETIVEVPATLALKDQHLYQAIGSNQLKLLESLNNIYQDFRLNIKANTFVANGELITKWDYALTQRFKGQMVETLLPNGAINNYFSLWEIDESGKKVTDLSLTEFEVTVNDQRKNQWFLWAPHLDVGVSTGLSTSLELRYGASIGFSIAGHGKTLDDLTWRFLRLSMEIQEELGLGLSLIQYNLGKPLPLVSNIWLGSMLNITSKEKQLLLFLGAVL